MNNYFPITDYGLNRDYNSSLPVGSIEYQNGYKTITLPSMVQAQRNTNPSQYYHSLYRQ